VRVYTSIPKDTSASVSILAFFLDSRPPFNSPKHLLCVGIKSFSECHKAKCVGADESSPTSGLVHSGASQTAHIQVVLRRILPSEQSLHGLVPSLFFSVLGIRIGICWYLLEWWKRIFVKSASLVKQVTALVLTGHWFFLLLAMKCGKKERS